MDAERGDAERSAGWLGKLAPVRAGETRALLWSFAYFFCLLSAYYILRPLRDEMGVTGGTRNLPWLFTATFVSVLVVAPLQGLLVATMPRRVFIPVVFNILVASIAVFWLLFTLHVNDVWVARVFFVWTTVFSVFTVSLFWSFMADMWRSEQAKRLFAFIAAGGSLGNLIGPTLTVWLAKPIGPVNLLIVTAVLVELAVLCAWRLEKAIDPAGESGKSGIRLGGNGLAGLPLLLKSPYLSGIAFWVFLLSFGGTFVYLMQAELVKAASADSAERTRIFASIELSIGIATMLMQILGTGRLMKRFGVGVCAAAAPLIFVFGFGLLALTPTVVAVLAFQTVQRSANFGISNPAREVWWTASDREEKYKTKPFVDGVVFRGSDAFNAWLYSAVQMGAGLGIQAMALIAAPVCALWIGLSFVLGRAQEKRAAQQAAGG
jgi:AAA family ATP:ADP antiporter